MDDLDNDNAHDQSQAQIGDALDHMDQAGVFGLDLATPAGKRMFANAIFQALLRMSGAPASLIDPAEAREENAGTDKQAALDAAALEQAPVGGETEGDPSPQPDITAQV